MPIYEYSCDGCGHQLEALQKINDPLLKTCPECSQDALRKRVSAASFRLKGGGWYETDFKDKGKKPAKAASAGEASGENKGKDDTGTSNKEDKKKVENKGSDSGTGKDSNKSDKTATG